MPTIVTETIGSDVGDDFATIAAWISAHDGENLVSQDKVYIGQLQNEAHEVDSNALTIDTCTTDATRYRALVGQNRYLPHQNTATRPVVYVRWGTGTGEETGIKVVEDHFHAKGFGIICEDPKKTGGASGNVKAGIKIEGDGARIASIFLRISDSSQRDDTGTAEPFFYCYWIDAPSGKADDAMFFNCIAMGSPFRKGANVGWLFDTGASNGGLYFCAASDVTRGTGRGMWSATASGDEPELIGNVALGCISACFQGIWSRYAFNVSSDTTAIAAMGGPSGTNGDGDVNLPDPYSTGFSGSRTNWTYAGVQDFRIRQGGVLPSAVNGIADPNDPTLTINAVDVLGIEQLFLDEAGVYEDFAGTARDGTPSIGPFEAVANSATTGPPTEIVDQIGPGQTYTTIQAWLDSTEGLHLVNRNEVRIGQLNIKAGGYDQGGSTLKIRRSITDATHYRALRTVPGIDRVDPTTGAGVLIKGTGASGNETLPVVDIREDGFLLEGVRVDQTYTGTGSRRVVRVTGDWVRVNAVWIDWVGGTGSTNVGLEFQGNRGLITNVLATGKGDNAAGMTFGLQIHDCLLTHVLCCMADKVDGNGGGAGIHEAQRAVRSQISSCISIASGTDDYRHDTAGNAPLTQDHNIASDTTADGPGSQDSASTAALFEDYAAGNYRLKDGSPAEKRGANLSVRFDQDFEGRLRRAPFDCGIFEGIGAAAQITPSTPARTSYLATCWEIKRTDGVSHYFTDANCAIPHGGRTYKPAGGLNASNRRSESGTGESSVAAQGAVTSDEITVADLRSGRFRGASVIERVIDWRHPWRLPIVERHFKADRVRFDGEVWDADFLGPGSNLERASGELITLGCGTDLGSETCGVDLFPDTQDDVRVSSTIADVRRKFDAESADIPSSYADDFFGRGLLIWLSGANSGLSSRVKTYTKATRTIELEHRLPNDIVAGDKFYLEPGCRKRYRADCVTKFGNGPRFYGDPYIEGTDKLLQTPQR